MGLKILQVGSGMPGWAGTEKHIMDISPVLERHGHRITIGCQPGSEIERRALAIGLPIVHLRMDKQHDWRQFPQFVGVLRDRYDVVHTHSYLDYIVPAAAARLARVPVVVMTRHIPFHFRNALVANACSKFFYDRIIAVSDFIREVLIGDHVSPDRIVVVKNGIDPELWLRGANAHVREELGIPASAFVVAAAGRLIPGKGFDILVRAVAAARRTGVNVLCIIAGEGEARTQLEDLIKELDVQAAVRVLGFRPDVPAIFGAADVVAVPSSTLPEAFSYTALTGVDTDRLPEEKRRGITIDLGFAPLLLDGVGTVGVVDVPGHETFVRTMVAGATGIDAALLVVAADEGVMPQTREHIAILDLLGVRRGVVALTKSDLVEDAWCEMVAQDIALALAGTGLAGIPCIPVSSVTRQGIGTLVAQLTEIARDVAERDADDLVRLPIDRVFTKAGTGTVVTGTLWSGALRNGDEVTLLPGARRARVRGLQSHGHVLDHAMPGTRVAVALAGLDRDAIMRGDVLVTDSAWTPAVVLRADMTLLAAAAPLTARSRVRFHLGTFDVGARVICVAGPLRAGETRPVRIALDSPVVARGGDRFVMRLPSPVGTIGGGTITDAAPPRRRVRPFEATGLDAQARLARMLDEAGTTGIREASVPVRVGLLPSAVRMLAGAGGDVVRIGADLISRRAVDAAASSVLRWLDAHHKAHPREAGASLENARAECHAPAHIADDILARLEREGAVAVEGAIIRRAGWTAAADDGAAARRAALLARLDAAGAAVPHVAELEREFGVPVIALLRQLEREKSVIALSADRFASARAAGDLWSRVAPALSPSRGYRPTELRAVFGLSRQYLMPWLDYFDRLGRSRREGDERWFKTGSAGGG